ncbi:hypothetical protein ACFL55_01270 [Candidatus Latescibacterota bacterium]
MNSLPQSSLEYEKSITDFEERFHISRDALGNEKQLTWLPHDPADVWPLIASLADKPESVIGDIVLKQKARSLPVIISYSESVMMELFFNDLPKGETFKALEGFGISKDAIVSAASEGVIRLEPDKNQPFTLENSLQCLNLLMKLLIDEPDDLCQSLKSIHAEGPFKHIQGMKIIVRHGLEGEVSDVAWLTVSGMKDSDVKKAVSLISKSHTRVIVPLVFFNKDNETPDKNGTAGQQYIANGISKIAQSLEVFSDKIIYPPLPLHRTWYMRGVKERSYDVDCLALIWKTTQISGLNATIDRRSKTITDFVSQKPTSVLGMLRQLARLKVMQTFPDFTAYFPDGKEFKAFLQQALDQNLVLYPPVEEEKGGKEITPEFIPEAPPKIRKDIFVEHAEGFLNELMAMDFYKVKQEKFTRYAEELNRERASWSSEKRETFIAGIDGLLDQVWDNLDTLDTTLKSALHDQEARLHLLEDSADSLIPEYIDKALFFWGEFVQLSLKKIQLKPPADEINEICTDSTKKFLTSLSHTPPDEGAFRKYMDSRWPVVVKSIRVQINDLLDDTSQIWELKINEGLMKLEEFRKKNLRQEPKISTQITLKVMSKPVLENALNVKIKKQGLIKMFVSQSEKEEWKKETVGKISKYVKKIMKQYESDILKWLKSLEKNIHEYFLEIDKMGKDALRVLDEKKAQAGKTSKEAELLQREIDTIEQNIDTLLKKKKSYHVMKQKWIGIKEKQS